MPRTDFSEFFPELETPTADGKIVPNVQPKIDGTPYRIAIVGEAPGADEVIEGVPFVGWSGKTLDKLLSNAGILRDACFIGNVCQQRPAGNKIANFNWDGPGIQNGLT